MKLYKKTKTGKIQVWSIEKNGPLLEIEYGQLNGKMQKVVETCLPKNVGKSNETTGEEQAAKEMASMIKKQKDKGYFDSVAQVQQKRIAPMLAHKFEDYEHKVTYPCVVQPKLDGVRCLYHSGKLWSRMGKEYKLDHISDCLKTLNLNSQIVLDGEIYVHNSNLQTINSLVKDYREESKVLEYHIYDICHLSNINIPYKSRIPILELYCLGIAKPLNYICGAVCNSKEDLTKNYNDFIQQGYEGAMLRLYEYPYELGQRSHGLLKIKSFQDEEFEIVGYKEGSGKLSNCIIFTCKTENGKTFDVVPKGTLEEKALMYKNGQSYIGKLLKVKFFNRSQDNIPIFPVGICVLSQEDI